MHAGERPKETPEVVALQNYLAECRDEKIYKLKDEIKIVAERVMFLLYYGTVTRKRLHYFLRISFNHLPIQLKKRILIREHFYGQKNWSRFWI